MSGAAASSAVQFSLPAPTGRYAAGEDVLHLVDTSRLDPWVPASGHRQLTVSMFYPARQGTGQPAAYMSLGEAQGFLQYRVPAGTSLTPELIASAQTQAFANAKAAPGRFPLVVLSPGLQNPRATLTSLATELASHGYVVALVGHPGEDSGELLADGSISPCVTCGPDGPGSPTVDAITANRGVDVKFVVDQLVGGHVWKLGHLIDQRTIGMAGHSIGGAAAAAAMQADPRIRAGVNMDGTFHPAVPAGALGGRAFMMFGRDESHSGHGGDQSWNESWADLDGYKRWFAVAGASHAAFTDVTILAQQAGIPIPGTLEAFRGSQITRAYVTAFFDKTLKGCPEPLLDGASTAYPEVEVQP